MVNVAIVEDEIRSADVLCGFLERYGSEKGREFAVSRFTDAIAFLENYVPRYDIVFMDIQLPDMDGMTASRRLRALDRDVILIFVTNMANYAVSGYEVDALDFIVKPVSYFPFTVKLERALGRLDGRVRPFVYCGRRGVRTAVRRAVRGGDEAHAHLSHDDGRSDRVRFAQERRERSARGPRSFFARARVSVEERGSAEKTGAPVMRLWRF